jgi:hypothetical protein
MAMGRRALRRWSTCLIGVVVVAVLAAGCGSEATVERTAARTCPSAWRAGWQRLANRIGAPVYCPAWLPNPLSASFAGSSYGGTFVEPDRNYLVTYIESDVVGSSNTEVHVNLRGYPGRTAIPVCHDTMTAGGKVLHPKIPCFADTYAHKRIAGHAITIYTANQGADKWHIAYVWPHGGSLYVASEHVTPPYTFAQVLHNLGRVVRSLVLVRPTRAGNTSGA